MKRLVIAVDCDDVLVRTTPYFVDTYNQKYGTNATLAQANDTAFEIWNADEQTQVDRWTQLTYTEGYKALRPDPEEATILRQLAVNHELHLVTARKEEERSFTQEMLERELPGVFTSMEFVGWTGSKGEVCERLKADVLIDDNARHLHNAIERQRLSKSGAILFGDYPWNAADSMHDALTHCLDWPSVMGVINRLAEADVENDESNK